MDPLIIAAFSVPSFSIGGKIFVFARQQNKLVIPAAVAAAAIADTDRRLPLPVWLMG